MQFYNLESGWNKLFIPFQSKPHLVKKIFWELVTAYSRNDRYYHNLLHIQHVLSIVSMLESLAHNFPSIQMAAWFHDVVYDTKAKDNEEKSAEYASESLKNLGISWTIVSHVVSMILNTKKHYALPDDIDSQILLDADLSILGLDELEYKAYAQAICREYSWVPDAEYRIARKIILQDFLKRDRIYFTNKAFEMLEAKARENIKTEISKL